MRTWEITYTPGVCYAMAEGRVPVERTCLAGPVNRLFQLDRGWGDIKEVCAAT